MRLVTVTPNPSIDRLYELDRLVRDAVNRPVTETLVAGGKGLNVARAATALGAEVRAVALLAGHAGRWMADQLAAEGIVGRLDLDGRRDPELLRDPRHRRWDADRAQRGRSVRRRLDLGRPRRAPSRAELVQGGVGMVTISGSLPPGAPTDGLRQLASVAAALGVPVALDAGGEIVRLASRPGRG